MWRANGETMQTKKLTHSNTFDVGKQKQFFAMCDDNDCYFPTDHGYEGDTKFAVDILFEIKDDKERMARLLHEINDAFSFALKDTLIPQVHQDLVDTWERQNELEKRIVALEQKAK